MGKGLLQVPKGLQLFCSQQTPCGLTEEEEREEGRELELDLDEPLMRLLFSEASLLPPSPPIVPFDPCDDAPVRSEVREDEPPDFSLATLLVEFPLEGFPREEFPFLFESDDADAGHCRPQDSRHERC